MDKILPVFKPIGFSTFDLLRIFKRETGFSGKLGHAGTLDPFACGVVLLLLGSATKRFEEIKKQEKLYLAGLKLGAESSTGDPEGTIRFISSKKPAQTEIKKVLKDFVGEIQQKVPAFSAAKFKGVPLYKLARKGKKIQKTKKVKIRKIELLSYKYPLLSLRIFCSGGTYVRQVAQDIGEKLKCGALLYYLEREAIGEFHKKQCYLIEDFTKRKKTLLG